MGNAVAPEGVTFQPATPGKRRLCVSGFKVSPHTGRAQQIAASLAAVPGWESWFYFGSDAQFRGPDGLMTRLQAAMPADHPLRAHRTSPFCWIESAEPIEGGFKLEGRNVFVLPLGGRDKTSEYLLRTLPANDAQFAATRALCETYSFFDSWVDETPGTAQRNAN